jgi:hypothetical protein
MTRLNNSAYPSHPWRTTSFMGGPREGYTNEPNCATMRDLAFNLEIPALQRFMETHGTPDEG